MAPQPILCDEIEAAEEQLSAVLKHLGNLRELLTHIEEELDRLRMRAADQQVAMAAYKRLYEQRTRRGPH